MEADKIDITPLALSVIAVALMETVPGFVPAPSASASFWVLGAVRLFQAGLIVLIFSIWGGGVSAIGLAPSKMRSGFKTGLLWSAVFGLATLFALTVLFLLNIDPLGLIQTHVPPTPFGIVGFFLVGGVVGPVAEEVFFRGVVYGFFRRWGVAAAVAASSGLFVAAHLPGLPVTQAIGAVVFALAYERAGSLAAPIVIHVLGNCAMFALSLLA